MANVTLMMRQSATDSAASIARWIEVTTAFKSVILPLSIPFEGQLPTPRTFTTPSGNTSPTTATTLEVPTSKPTMVFDSTILDIF